MIPSLTFGVRVLTGRSTVSHLSVRRMRDQSGPFQKGDIYENMGMGGAVWGDDGVGAGIRSSVESGPAVPRNHSRQHQIAGVSGDPVFHF